MNQRSAFKWWWGFLLCAWLCVGCGTKQVAYSQAAGPPHPVSGLSADMVAAPVPANQPEKAASIENFQTSSSIKRQLVYTADMTMVVDHVAGSLVRIRQLAEKTGGYMSEMTQRSIIIRVPAAAFEKTVYEIGLLGDVSDNNILSTDVTEEMMDLEIRLSNADMLRKRMIALLDRADKVEDAIRLEKELARITEKIERLKGRIRYLTNQVSFATISVRLNASVPQQKIRSEIPFAWVRHIGREATPGRGRVPHTSGSSKISITLPDAFAYYYKSKNTIRALSADGVRIKVTRHENTEGGTLGFWTELIRRSLLLEQAMSVADVNDVVLIKKGAGKLIQAVKALPLQQLNLHVMVAQTENYVFTCEAWGETDAFNRHAPAILSSFQTLKMKSSFF